MHTRNSPVIIFQLASAYTCLMTNIGIKNISKEYFFTNHMSRKKAAVTNLSLSLSLSPPLSLSLSLG